MTNRTPLYKQHLEAGGRMVDFAGWEMPQQYSSVKEEHRAVRTSAGLFDVSHMGRFHVGGADAGAFLQETLTNDVSRVEPGRAQYNLMCRGDGGVLDDLVAYRRDHDWMLVVNAANRQKDLAWLRGRATPQVELTDRSDEISLLALQGPRASAILPIEGVDVGAVPYFGTASGRIAGAEVWVSRTGYTGEDGFEIFVPSEKVQSIWSELLEAGAIPCGLACRDVCRLEAGLRLYGTDMDEQTNPYEAGLGWTVKLAKGSFVGRERLELVKSAGPQRTLVGIVSTGRTIPRHDAAVSVDGDRVGRVTSGTYSFWLEEAIGMALVQTRSAAAAEGAQLSVETRSGEGSARVVGLPFYRGTAGKPGSKQH